MKVSHVRLAWVAAKPDDFPRDGRPEVCLMGRSNVGKSSLMNRLIGHSGMARVSKTPGRTREVHFYLLDDRFYIVDLPGFGYAKVPVAMRRNWGALVESYFANPRPLRLGIQLVDVRHDPTVLDCQLAAMLLEHQIPFALVLTKADKVSNNHVAKMKARAPKLLGLPPGVPVIATSAEKGTGVGDLSQLVVGAFTKGLPDAPGDEDDAR